ncbi:protein YgfX [Marinimicrobium sp. ABcell2]|uniref:protein YgfX n=1 Tax=Marinimicrobium sp. ABcell2 TaxID=3069751 RepID=UPI0027B4D6E3|nr:protein YgfX [Marinimicrobium sp. ABcell2]MDQ2075275.1 hypothetical protein [Marinimicrobium sp. ABcell2]
MTKTIEPAKPSTEATPAENTDYLMPVPLRPSRYLFWGQALLIVCLASASAFALSPHLQAQPLWGMVLFLFWALLALAAYGIWQAHKHGPSKLSYRQGDWYLTLDGVEFRAALIGDLVIHSRILVARFRLHASGAKVNLICLPDSVSRDDFRRLRVWLRIYLWHVKR